MTKQRTANGYTGGPLMQELEPRILLSADLPTLDPSGDFTDGLSVSDSDASLSSSLDSSLDRDGPAEASEARELVIIDAATPDAEILLHDLLSQADDGRPLEVFVLDANRDGVDQISSLLTERSDIAVLHIISHGSDGSISLGNTVVDNDELVTRAASFQGWSDTLSADGDILIYGCDLAAGPEGRALIDALARLTEADVAASDDLTGGAGLGGDWDLEYLHGSVEASIAVSADFQASFDSVLSDTVYAAQESSDSELEIRGNENWGQTFQYTSGDVTYEANYLELQMRRDPNANPKTITVELRDSWNGTVLAYGSIDASELSTSLQWERLYLGTVELDDGQSYTIRVTASNSAGGVFLASNTAGGYPDGTQVDSSGLPVAGADIAFRIGQVENDAPVNIVPLAQSMLQDATLVFSTNNGNAISVSDDAGANDELVVSLEVDNGVLSLSQTTGLTFIDGDGAADSAMTFAGTQSDINAALEGLTYTPTTSWSGTDTLTITTNDQGNPGIANLDGHPSLEAAYSFDVDGSDWVGNKDATLNNGATIVVDPERGSVLETDGLDDYVSVPASVTNNSSQFTFSFWVRTAESGSSLLYYERPTLLGMEIIGSGADDLVINTNDGYIGFWTGLSGTDAVYQSTTTRINDNEWHLITLSNDGSTASLYVDGVFEASLATGASLGGYSYFIGAQSVNGLPGREHSGRFDEVRFFSSALTANEVSTLYGLSDTDQISITVSSDSTAPLVTVDALITNDTTPQLSGTVDDPDATVQVTVDGNAYTATNNGDGTWSLAAGTITPALADGTYDISVTATDDAGNAGSDTTTSELVIDTSAPLVTVDALVTNDTTPQLSGTVDDPDATVQVTVDGNAYTATNNGDGTWTLAAGTITPALADGTYDISVTATDDAGNAGSDTTTSELVIDTNTAPVAIGDAYTMRENGSLVTVSGIDDVLQNDSDTDGDPLTVTTIPLVGPTNGTLLLNPDGTFTYTPDPGFHGVDTFSYEVSDGQGGLAQATVIITITPVNAIPEPTGDNYSVQEDGNLVIGVAQGLTSNDSDADGDLLTVAPSAISGPSNGLLILADDGSFTYSPNPNFHGIDDFVYEVDDGNGGIASASVTIDVTPVNDDPVAVTDNFGTPNSAPLAFSAEELIANDTDADGDILSIVSFTTPPVGTLAEDGDGNYIYTPAPGFEGTDSFSYTVADTNGGSATVFVFVEVTAAVGGWLNEEPADASPSSQGDQQPTRPVTDTAVSDAEAAADDARDGAGAAALDSLPATGELAASGGPSPLAQIKLQRASSGPRPTEFDESGALGQDENRRTSDGGSTRFINQRLTALARGFEFQGFALKNAGLNYDALWQALDAMKDQMRNIDDDGEQGPAAVITTVAAGTSLALSAGFISWVLRGGALASTLLSTMPMWKGFDPLPLLAARRRSTADDRQSAEATENNVWSRSIMAERMFFEPPPDREESSGTDDES